jgi:hypothetical protein
VKEGDLVRTTYSSPRHGILIERVQDPFLGMTNKVFTVLWENGTIGSAVWEYDLELINESR